MKKFVLLMKDGRQITVEADSLEEGNGTVSLVRHLSETETVASFFREHVQGWWIKGSVDAEPTREEKLAAAGLRPAAPESIEIAA